ncbi:MAG: hypothetical protein ACTTJS_08270 [Wolinella sp.]
MADTSVGIALNLAVKGLVGIEACTSSFAKLRKAVSNAGVSMKHLNRDLAKIKLNNTKRSRSNKA